MHLLHMMLKFYFSIKDKCLKHACSHIYERVIFNNEKRVRNFIALQTPENPNFRVTFFCVNNHN